MKSHVGQTLRLPGSSCALGSKNCKKPVQTQVFVFDWSMVECEKMGVGDHHPDLFAFLLGNIKQNPNTQSLSETGKGMALVGPELV